MDDYVIMPQADYKDACDATREKTGGTEPLKSGELGAAIRGIPSGGSGVSLADVDVYVADFYTDEVAVTAGALDVYKRIIVS